MECTANQGSEETSTHETEKGEELLVSSSDPIQDAIVTQSAFVLGDVPSDLSPTTLNSLSYSPSYFIGQYVDPSLPMTTRPRKLRHYPPIFGGSRHFLPESYDERQNCQLQVIPITAPPGTEQYWGHIDNCVLPHYFKN